MNNGRVVAIGGEEGDMSLIWRNIVSLARVERPRLVFLPTASYDEAGDEDALKATFAALGCSSFQTVRLTEPGWTREKIRETILNADAVFAGGGNLAFLMDVWIRTGADAVLREAFDAGIVLSGNSSGAMCWFEEGYDDCGEDHAYTFVDCLGLLAGCNCPHYENEHWKSFAEAVKTRSRSGIACEDGAALIYDRGVWRTAYSVAGRNVWYLDRAKGFAQTRWEELAETPAR